MAPYNLIGHRSAYSGAAFSEVYTLEPISFF
jgi:hypothetical protein